MCRFSVARELTVLLIIFGGDLAVSAAPSINDVRAAIEDYEKSIVTLGVRSRCNNSVRSFEHPDTITNLVSNEHTIAESSGRIRVEVDGQSYRVDENGKSIVRPRKSIGTFDGSSSRFAYGPEKPVQGMVTQSRDDIIKTLDPREMTTHYYGEPISNWINSDSGAAITGTAVHEGREVLVIERKPVEKNGLFWGMRFWVDPSLAFTVVKRAQTVRFPNYDDPLEYTHTTGYEYRQANNGTWLPRRIIHESFNAKKEHARDGTKPPLAWRGNIENSEWVVNPVATDDMFTLRFAPGTEVEDKITGRIYKVSGISEEMLERNARIASEFAGRRPNFWRRIALITNVAVVVAIAAAVLWRKTQIGRR